MDTSNKTEVFSFTWEIENYYYYPSKKGECLVSPEFFINVIGPIHFELYPQGDVFDDKDDLLLNLITTCNMGDFFIHCDLNFKNSKGIQSSFAKVETVTRTAYRWQFKKRKLVSIKNETFKLEESIHDLFGVLVVQCQFSTKRQNKDSYNIGIEDIGDIKILSEEIEAMCCNSQHSDFVLIYQNARFPLHKPILQARVPKLAADLKITDNKEATLDVSNLSNITPNVFKSFLNYVYSGKLPLLSSDVVKGLHQLSNLYDITVLKEKLHSCPTSIVTRSTVRVDHKSFTWTFPDFENGKVGDLFVGPFFNSGVVKSSDLHFSATFEEDPNETLDLKIKICHLFPNKNASFFVKLSVTILNHTGEEKFMYVDDHYFNEESDWYLPSFFKMKKLDVKKVMYTLPNGAILCLKGKDFRLQVDCIISDKSLSNQTILSKTMLTTQLISAQSSNDVERFSHDIGSLYNIFLPVMTDVVLWVGDVRFPAHKVIIAARSSVFSRMFEHEMLEKKEEVVYISDMDVATLNLMLNYMYSGRVDMVSEYNVALKLYTASDKYDIKSLKVKCANILKSKMVVANVTKLFCLADMHSDTELKDFAKDYICRKSNIVMRLPGWKDLIRDRPDLATEIITTVVDVIISHKQVCRRCIKGPDAPRILF